MITLKSFQFSMYVLYLYMYVYLGTTVQTLVLYSFLKRSIFSKMFLIPVFDDTLFQTRSELMLDRLFTTQKPTFLNNFINMANTLKYFTLKQQLSRKEDNNCSYLLFKTKCCFFPTPHTKFCLNKNVPNNRFHVNCYLKATCNILFYFFN